MQKNTEFEDDIEYDIYVPMKPIKSYKILLKIISIEKGQLKIFKESVKRR